MNRRTFMAVVAPGAASMMIPGMAAAASTERLPLTDATNRPRVLFFDVNETLLDLGPLKQSATRALGGRPELVPLWFTTMLQYSLVDTVADRYHDFGRIGAATMVMVAQSNGLDLSLEDAQAAIAPIRSLPPHPEVVPALQALKEAGFRMATLTNSPPTIAQAQLENAGIAELFEERLSVEGVLLYKPHSHVYRWAAHQMGVQPAESMLVASHGWDIAGALWAGWRAAFLGRPGAQLYPLAPIPEIVQPDLRQAAELLIALDR